MLNKNEMYTVPSPPSPLSARHMKDLGIYEGSQALCLLLIRLQFFQPSQAHLHSTLDNSVQYVICWLLNPCLKMNEERSPEVRTNLFPFQLISMLTLLTLSTQNKLFGIENKNDHTQPFV